MTVSPGTAEPTPPGTSSSADTALPGLPDRWRSSAFGLAVVAGLTVPPLASVATVALLWYVSGPPFGSASAFAATVGLAVALALTMVTGFYLWCRATPEGVNGRQYGEILARLQSIHKALDAAFKDSQSGLALAGWQAANCHVQALEDMLKGDRSVNWVTGVGYINAWSELHRGEESFILCAPVAMVVSGAGDDELRLQGSDIPNHDILIGKLRLALTDLDVSAVKYTVVPPPTPPTVPAPAPSTPDVARAVIQDVRYSINRYRDGIWEGLVDAKNLLLAKVAMGWMITYLFLLLVVLTGAPGRTVAAASLFFLTGVVVGAVSDISQQTMDQSAVEDYGLNRARFWGNIFISGVAAIIGVALVAILGLSIVGLPLSSSASAPRSSPGVPSWATVFDWNQNPVGFAVAAAFGFTPSRLFDVLKGRSTATEKLQSSQATGTSPPS